MLLWQTTYGVIIDDKVGNMMTQISVSLISDIQPTHTNRSYQPSVRPLFYAKACCRYNLTFKPLTEPLGTNDNKMMITMQNMSLKNMH